MLTPFSEDYLKLKDDLKECFSQSSIEITHAADLPAEISLPDGSLKLLENANIVLADISNSNPNVFYEIGRAKAMNIKIILLVNNIVEVPFELSKFQVIRYGSLLDLNAALFKEKSTKILSTEILEKKIKERNKKSESQRQFDQYKNPFNYLSAESLESTSLLNLFVEPPYYKDLMRPITSVVVGGRGSGKTTLFSKMQFDSLKFLSNDQTKTSSRLFSFYVNFNTTFRFLDVEKILFTKDELVKSYFNLIFVQSIITTIDKLFSNERILEEDALRIILVLYDSIGIGKLQIETIPKMVLSFIESINIIKQDLISGKSISINISRGDYLEDLVSNLKKTSALFSKNLVTFLLDDYASDWLPSNVSVEINKIIFRRSRNYIFKIATIPGRYLFTLGTDFNAQFPHDFDLINIDYNFGTIPESISEEYLCTIINKRLNYIGVNKDCDYLFNSETEKDYPIDYSGTLNLVKLFAGDIRSLLNTCSRMISKTDSLLKPIPREIQNRMVTGFSQEKFNELNDSFQAGEYASEFLRMFMEVSYKMYGISKKQTQSSKKFKRLEGFQIKNRNKIKKDTQIRLQWLIQTGVLKEFKKGIKNEQYILRGIYFPAFNIPVSSPGQILKINIKEIELMLNKPQEFASHFYTKNYSTLPSI